MTLNISHILVLLSFRLPSLGILTDLTEITNYLALQLGLT